MTLSRPRCRRLCARRASYAREISGLDDLAGEIIGLDDLFARAPATERMSAGVAAGAGGLAVLLALTGIYGALAYAASRRRREIGVRMALGAAPAAVARTIVRDALTVTSIGLAPGCPRRR